MNKDFLEALSKLQESIKAITKGTDNPYFKSKYADLNALFAEINPKLVEQHWVLIQAVKNNVLHTELYHLDTMEKLESDMDLLTAKPDMQQLGSAITYARRYSLLALLNIETVDDDGNSASGKEAPNKTAEILNALENTVNSIETVESLQKFYNDYKIFPLILPIKKEFNEMVSKRKEALCK